MVPVLYASVGLGLLCVSRRGIIADFDSRGYRGEMRLMRLRGMHNLTIAFWQPEWCQRCWGRGSVCVCLCVGGICVGGGRGSVCVCLCVCEREKEL